jgi:hypothetical protein
LHRSPQALSTCWHYNIILSKPLEKSTNQGINW